MREALVAMGPDLLGTGASRVRGVSVKGKSTYWRVGGEQRRSVIIERVEEPAAAIRSVRDSLMRFAGCRRT